MKGKEKIVEYKTGVPLDKDMKDTQKHIADQEKEHGTWTLKKDPADAAFNAKKPDQMAKL